MSFCNTVAAISKSYLSAPIELYNCKKNSASTNILAGLKLFSFLFVLPPLIFGIAWGCSSLCERNVDPNHRSEASGRANSAVQRTFIPPYQSKFVPEPAFENIKEFVREVRRKVAEAEIPDLKVLRSREMFYAAAGGEDHFNPPITTIIPGFLYLGMETNAGVFAGEDLAQKPRKRNESLIEMQARSIKTIFTCSKEIAANDKYEGIDYVLAPMGDSKLNHQKFMEVCDKAVEQIEKARKENRPILIHCEAGSSRSPSVVLAYLMMIGIPFTEALRYVKNKRLVVDASNFEQVLKETDLVQKLRLKYVSEPTL